MEKHFYCGENLMKLILLFLHCSILHTSIYADHFSYKFINVVDSKKLVANGFGLIEEKEFRLDIILQEPEVEINEFFDEYYFKGVTFSFENREGTLHPINDDTYSPVDLSDFRNVIYIYHNRKNLQDLQFFRIGNFEHINAVKNIIFKNESGHHYIYLETDLEIHIAATNDLSSDLLSIEKILKDRDFSKLKSESDYETFALVVFSFLK